MPAIILFAVWKNFGYNMIILLAALQTIPEDLYEAARIDGASGWQQFRHVTLPALAPMLLLVSILTMAGYFQLFAEPYVMTQGGPLQSTVQRALLHVRGRLQVVEPGRASAVAFLLFVLMFVVTVVQLRLGRERSGGMKRTARDGRSSTRCWSLGAVLDRVSAAVDGLGVVHAAGRGEHAFRRRCCRQQPTLDNYRELFASTPAWAATCSTALDRDARDADLAGVQHDGRLRLRQAARSRAASASSSALLGALVIPAQVAMMPLFLLLKELGLVNTYGGVIVPAMASVFGIFLVRQYALSLPDELLEAARIDGASEARIFWSLVVPLLRPILVTLAIFTFLGDLERLHVAADRADRPEAAHAAGRARRACRASTCRTTS